ncbi:hypothetical protein JOM56_014352 [Amanita muscaria]
MEHGAPTPTLALVLGVDLSSRASVLLSKFHATMLLKSCIFFIPVFSFGTSPLEHSPRYQRDPFIISIRIKEIMDFSMVVFCYCSAVSGAFLSFVVFLSFFGIRIAGFEYTMTF